MRGMLVAVVFGLLLHAACVAQAQTLSVGYYSKTCRSAESIVFDEVLKASKADRSAPAALLRLHFHDCFVNGCDASVLLDSTNKQQNPAEKDAKPNLSLRGYDVINNIKKRLEIACPLTVSCADILAYAARESVRIATGGYNYTYKVPGGRQDGTVSTARMAESNLPPHNQRNVDGLLLKSFTDKGLTKDDLIVLSGAHTLGVTKCGTFQYRLSNERDGMNATFRDSLRTKCNRIATNVASLDADTPYTFDTKYYANVLANKGVLESDAALNSPSTAGRVKQLRDDPYGFMRSFEAAMGKMGALRGANPGKVRQFCNKVRA